MSTRRTAFGADCSWIGISDSFVYWRIHSGCSSCFQLFVEPEYFGLSCRAWASSRSVWGCLTTFARYRPDDGLRWRCRTWVPWSARHWPNYCQRLACRFSPRSTPAHNVWTSPLSWLKDPYTGCNYLSRWIRGCLLVHLHNSCEFPMLLNFILTSSCLDSQIVSS